MNKDVMRNPLSELMSISSEIFLASAQTIGYRTLMMAGINVAALTRRERAEFSRMYTEKLQAMMDDGQIMVREIGRLNQQLATMAWSEFVSTGTAMVSLSTGGSPASTLATQRHLISSAGQRVGNAFQKMSITMARATVEGLTPMHTAVTANARRLGRSRR